MSTILGLLLLAGASLAIVLTVRGRLPLASAHTRAIKETPQERQDRVHQMEHDLGVVEKHEPWEKCRRCHIDNAFKSREPQPKFDLEALRRLEYKAKMEYNAIIERDERGWMVRRADDDYYEITNGWGQVVAAIPRIPPAEYMPNYKIPNPPQPSAPPERFQR